MIHVSPVAANPGFQPPGPADFQLPDIFKIEGHAVLATKVSFLLILAAIIVYVFFLSTARQNALVPSKSQYIGEQAYAFVRNDIAESIIGPRDFRRYVPFLFTLFFFLLVNNLFGLIPILQFSPFSHAGFAYALAGLVWILYNSVGIARHGFIRYAKLMTMPSGVPWWILPLLIPLEFLSNIIVRPITLSLRLFANMFAGHLLLLLFATGGEYLLIHATGNFILKPAGVLSFALGVAVGFLELVVAILQAYVFTLLTAQYIAGSLASEH